MTDWSSADDQATKQARPRLGSLTGLDNPALDRLWTMARNRMERSGRTFGSTPIKLSNLTVEEAEAICSLLGRRRPSKNQINIDLHKLDTVLRQGSSRAGLLDVLEAMGGPVRDLAAERRDGHHALESLWQGAKDHPASQASAKSAQRGLVDEVNPVGDWLDSLRRRGRLTRLGVDEPDVLLTQALNLIQRLMSNQESLLVQHQPLAVVAASWHGDAHALDAERPLGALVSDALRFLAGAGDERQAWAAFGVTLDQLSTSALVFGLPGIEGSICWAATQAAEPLRVTPRMLSTGFGLDATSVDQVWICENPAIMSMAADRLGPDCLPLICSEGMPSTATGTLLSTLASLGVNLRVHADFDFGGISIAGHIMERYGAKSWRFENSDYLAAVQGPTTALSQVIGPTPWDPLLGDSMNEQRCSVHEEALVDLLLEDLAR